MTENRKVGIAGTGSYLPPKVLTNDDLEKIVDTSDEWIFTRTGIKERHVAEKGQGVSDLAFIASQRALEAANVTPDDIDLIAVGTISADYRFPSTACLLQDMLGCRKIGAFDVSAACSGFIYALSMAWKQIETGMCDTALVVGGEVLTAFTNYTDRTSCILFGDGAGAVVLRADAEQGVLIDTSLGSDGSGADIMIVRGGGSKIPVDYDVLEKNLHLMEVRGREVYKYCTQMLHTVVIDILEKNGYSKEDLAWVIPHQMNMRIIEASARRMGTPVEKWYTNIERFGNTSGATIPIALDEAVRNGSIKKDDLLAMVAFGGGITWAGALLRW
ncbi:MAG: 3-oxoacyl-ACP synthase [Planctomycetota bacterium]|nr:MAG: 3-oxoacyl-ACP synthase [Planctomycetota bacterium]